MSKHNSKHIHVRNVKKGQKNLMRKKCRQIAELKISGHFTMVIELAIGGETM